MTTYRVEHRTTYRYGATMTDGYSVACLAPRPTEWQSVLSTGISVDPGEPVVDAFVDAFGNRQHQFGVHVPHDRLVITAESIVDVIERPEPVDDTPWELVVERLAAATGALALETGWFRSSSALIDLETLAAPLTVLTRDVFTPGRPVVDAVRALCHEIYSTFEFDPHFSNVSTPLVEVLDERRGVCQDFAHLAIGCLRSVGLSAEYISGYIETIPPPGEERLVGADASHAWCSVWTPSAGWIAFDPTNDHLPANDHVTVAWGRDYADVMPVRGVMIGPAAAQALDVAVDVTRIG
ncbi:MAG: transglutaminase family protein [Ilumatobacter sp.]|nr:transglutaminase family protein [Ilumatobacter sp.]